MALYQRLAQVRMSNSFLQPLLWVTIFWYLVGALVLFLGHPDWAEHAYLRLTRLPWVPELELGGLATAARVQWTLVLHWTVPVLLLWGSSAGIGFLLSVVKFVEVTAGRKTRLAPRGEFWGVAIPGYSQGALPPATTPALTGAAVQLPGGSTRSGAAKVELSPDIEQYFKLLSEAERQLCEELLQLLYARPDHFAGLGHGVGLLEHTLNVMVEAAPKVTADFRLPLVAALAHDIGKLVTFQPDGKGGWKKRGLHSRESARILATLPGFARLPDTERTALILAVKYDHAPNKMPELQSQAGPSALALRIISALSAADKQATADEKERNLVKLQPEDLLWDDFVRYLREAPVVQRGKTKVANQINNPSDSPFLYIYEAPWRDEAILRMPPEVAAALDLTRRDPGKLAKYTRILVERLRKEGLLLEEHNGEKVTEANPLWNISSGTPEKSINIRGVLVLKADALWKVLNYRLSVKSPYPVQVVGPNADENGNIIEKDAQRPQRSLNLPETSEKLDVGSMESAELDAMGLFASEPAKAPAAKPATPDQEKGKGSDRAASSAPAPGTAAPAHATAAVTSPKPKSRGRFAEAGQPATSDDALFGLTSTPAGAGSKSAQALKPKASPAPVVEPAAPAAPEDEAPVTATSLLAGALEAMRSAGEDSSVEPDPEALGWAEPEPEPDPIPNNPPVELPSGSPEKAFIEAVAKDPGKKAPEKSAPQKKVPADSKDRSKQPLTTEKVASDKTRSANLDDQGLSRSERREKLRFATEEDAARYQVKVGDKIYTEDSPAVVKGVKKPGDLYGSHLKGGSVTEKPVEAAPAEKAPAPACPTPAAAPKPQKTEAVAQKANPQQKPSPKAAGKSDSLLALTEGGPRRRRPT